MHRTVAAIVLMACSTVALGGGFFEPENLSTPAVSGAPTVMTTTVVGDKKRPESVIDGNGRAFISYDANANGYWRFVGRPH
jgi:hypothetical protein